MERKVYAKLRVVFQVKDLNTNLNTKWIEIDEVERDIYCDEIEEIDWIEADIFAYFLDKYLPPRHEYEVVDNDKFSLSFRDYKKKGNSYSINYYRREIDKIVELPDERIRFKEYKVIFRCDYIEDCDV